MFMYFVLIALVPVTGIASYVVGYRTGYTRAIRDMAPGE